MAVLIQNWARWGWPAVLMACVVLGGCDGRTWNNPYPKDEDGKNILYASFEERPKHLDPVRAYSENEYIFIAQIYEPPLQYHYLQRPYTLVPLTSVGLPRAQYYDQQDRVLPQLAKASQIAYTVYEIRIKPGIYYQPHPAFARDANGQWLYHALQPSDLKSINTLADFPQTGRRELVAADYIYQIKRMAHPKVHSPIFGVMSEYIIGLKDYAETLKQAYAQSPSGEQQSPYLDLSAYPLSSVQEVDRYTYRIKIKGKYPQFLYWMAMPFFAPVPPEADRFYSQAGMAEKNLNLDWYPVGTGPYMLTVNNPNRQMVLERNPNFHGEAYPGQGEPEDRAAGLLEDAGKSLPFIDKVIFSLEKESIPIWNKFLQGYYDSSSITSDSFDQAIKIGSGGEVGLTEEMQQQGIKLLTSVRTSSMYMGFNMLDPVIGTLDERGRKLRQAISIALDYEELITIFSNGRGIPAQGPLPPGIFGYRDGEAGINPYVYRWTEQGPQRKSIAEAQRLLAEAGYPNGIDAKTGAPLVLHLDISASGPDDKAMMDWYHKQFRKINIELDTRNTDYNRFQEKMLKGNAQIYIWGWNADYPDPENFLFLLYGPNGKVEHNGENASNYNNPEFNRLFEQMKNMENGSERQAIIDRMISIAQQDAPWIWGFHPKSFSLFHAWNKNIKPNLMANNTLKYRRLEPALRDQLRQQWNQPIVWPVLLTTVLLVLSAVPAFVVYRRHLRMSVKQRMTG